MACVGAGRMEREVLLTQVQNLVLCLRSNQSFTSKTSRFSSSATAGGNSGADQPFLAQALSLQKRLLSCCGPCVVSTHTAASDEEASHASACKMTQPGLSEDDVLDAFCQVCTSPDTTETMTNVALAGLVAIVTLPCSFLTAEGLYKISTAASRSKSEVTDRSAHEVLLAKISEVFVACARHPATTVLSEAWLCHMMSFLLAISVDRHASALLRRFAEKGVYSLVQIVFERVLTSLGASDATAERASSPVPVHGCMTLAFVSMLISGDIVAFDGSGTALLADGRCALDTLHFASDATPNVAQRQPGQAEGVLAGADALPLPAANSPPSRGTPTPGSSSPAPPSPSSAPAADRPTAPHRSRDGTAPTSPLTVFERNVHSTRGGSGGTDVVALQLEGLYMTQQALTVLGDTLNRDRGTAAAALIDGMQHYVSRALLIAGVSTTQVVVLSQILRTVHMTVRCASQHLVPQVRSFLQVLHLNQLTSLSEELRAAEAGLPISSSRRVGSPVFGGPASPASSNANGGFLSAAQINDLRERRVVVLESLAEFCADPNFCYYCYINYDLSWRYAPVLRVLCEALANNAVTPSSASGGASVETSGTSVKAGKANSGAGGGAAANDRSAAPVPLRASESLAAEASTRLITGLNQSQSQSPGLSAPPSRTPSYDGPALDIVLAHARAQKKLLQDFADAFEEAPLKKGIPFLLTNSFRAERGHEYEVMRDRHSWLVVAEPAGGREIGECLFRLSTVLSKRALGEYIGELGRELHPAHDEVDGDDDAAAAAALARSLPTDPEVLIPGTVLFFYHQLRGYMQQFDFRGKSLIQSIREMVFQLCLPGESQKIDRIMESFAHHWFVQNETAEAEKAIGTTVNPFHSESGAFVLSFAIIMLNTDLHSGKLTRNMAFNDFKLMNRGIDDKRDIPEAYLAKVYDDVQQHEIIMADMIERGFANDTTWDLQMRGPSVLLQMLDAPSNVMAALQYEPDLCASPNWRSSAVVEALNGPILEVIHPPCLLVLSGTLEACGELLDLEAPIRSATVAGGLDELRAQHRCEVDTFLNVLDGFQALTQASVCSGTPPAVAAVDQAMLALMPPIDIVPSGRPQDNMEDLFLSLCRLLRLRLVLELLPTAGAALQSDAWKAIAAMLLRLHYLGFFAWHVTEDAALAKAFSASHAGAEVPAGLCHNPRWIKTVQERRLEREAKQKQMESGDGGRGSGGSGNSGGGWLASLWSGGDKNEPDALECALLDAEPRVRECIPDVGRLLDILAHLPPAGRRALSAVLAEACTTSPPSRRDPVADLIVHSYTFHLLCAVVEPYRCLSSSWSPTATAVVQEKTDDAQLHALVLTASQRLIGTSLEMVATRRDPAFRSGVEALVRVATASLCTIQRRLLLCAALSACGGDGGGSRTAPSGLSGETVANAVAAAGPSDSAAAVVVAGLVNNSEHLSAPVWPLLQCLLPPEMPVPEYAELLSPVMMVNLSQTYAATLEVYRVRAATAPPQLVPTAWLRPPMLSPLPLFLPYVSAVILTLPPLQVPALQLPRVTAFLGELVSRQCYDVATQTDLVVVTAVSLKLLLQEKCRSKTQAPTAADVDMVALMRGIPDMLSLTARRVLLQRRGDGDLNHSNNNNKIIRGDDDEDDRSAHWLMVLDALCLLMAIAESPRDVIDIILVLQRTLLDAERSAMSASLVSRVYSEVLLPLVEHVCAHGSNLAARPKDGVQDVTEAPGAPRRSPFHVILPSAAKLLGAYETRHRMVCHVFSLGTQVSSATAVSPSAGMLPLWQASSSSIEVRCRLLNVLPKLLLQEAASLAATSPDTLRDLWQRVLGTLYAFCSTPKQARGDAAGGDAQQQLEAIEETVKNMVFVAASVLRAEGLPSSFDLYEFWVSTRQLITPFSFSAPLVGLITSLVQPGGDVALMGGEPVSEPPPPTTEVPAARAANAAVPTSPIPSPNTAADDPMNLV